MRLPPPLRPLWPVLKRGYTLATRHASPATTRLSRAGAQPLPRGAVGCLDDAVQPGGRIVRVRDAENLVRDEPQSLSRPSAAFGAQLRILIPRQAVAELPGGRVLGQHRAVITRDNLIVEELSTYFGTTSYREHPLFLRPFPGCPTEIDGRVAVLASRGDMNYFHFLIDVLPRLQTLAAAPEIAAADRWYLPARTGFQRELIAAVGLPADRVVDSASHPHIRAETLIVPTVPDLDLAVPRWIVPALRERLLDGIGALVPARRIYVTRGQIAHTRIVVNEHELVTCLAAMGFEVVDPDRLTVAEQIRRFAEAEVIVAPHGAALANLLFASPGATVVELFAPRYVQGCYWKLADTVPGLTYRYYVGLGRAPRHGRMWDVAGDITVDVEDLCSQLASLAPPLTGRRPG